MISPALEFGHRSSDVDRTGTRALSIIPNLPDLNLKFQLVTELLPDALANPVDELEDVRRLGAGMGDDEIGVAIGDFGAAESGAPAARPGRSGRPAETSGDGFLKMQPDDWWPYG